MINEKEYIAGIIAIPLKKQDSFIGISPNYLIIDSQQGWHKDQPFINLQTGQPKLELCIKIGMKFSNRRILTDNTNRMVETVFPDLDGGFQLIPLEFLFLIKDYASVEENATTINAILSLFQFKNGHPLEGFKAEVDVDKTILIDKDIFIRKIYPTLLNLNKEKFLEKINSLSIDLEEINEYFNFTELYNL